MPGGLVAIINVYILTSGFAVERNSLCYMLTLLCVSFVFPHIRLAWVSGGRRIQILYLN